MPKRKTYAIIHDGTHVLVGRGGNSGQNPQPRNGSHFPGGTVDPGRTSAQQLVLEIAQETGLQNIPAPGTPFQTQALPNIDFFVLRVPSVANLAGTFVRPNVVNVHDEPFAQVVAVTITSALQQGFFNPTDWTDWFGAGLQHAQSNNLLT